ncbi:MAG: hypothetical protein ABIJ41_08380 [Candidatus Omnitrophota bacterium]
MEFKKLVLSKKGQFLWGLVVFYALILLVAYSAIIFMQSINNSHQIQILYDYLQAKYNADKGASYAFAEIMGHSIGESPFFTHVPDDLNELIDREEANQGPIPSLLASDAEIIIDNDESFGDGSKIYVVKDNDGDPLLEVKIYRMDSDYYVLVKGANKGHERLFLHKINGISLYDYANFYSGNVSIGWQSIDAQQGKIHSNGDIFFNAGTKILNATEISTAGNFHWAFNPLLYPDDAVQDWAKTKISPFVSANENTTPFGALYNNLNHNHGHIAGMRYGLLACKDAGCTSVVPWNQSDANQNPILPWGDTTSLNIYLSGYGLDGAHGVNWWTDQDNPKQYVYLEQNYNCNPDVNCAMTDPVANNANYYQDNVYIQKAGEASGYYIPSILPDADTYPVNAYFNRSDQINVLFADSQQNAWQSFLESVGLDDVLLDQSSEVSQVTLPTVPVEQMMSEAQVSGGSMIFYPDKDTDDVHFSINAQNEPTIILLNSENNYTWDDEGCTSEPLVQLKRFMNHKTGLINRAIVVNIQGLEECQIQNPEKNYLPLDGTIVMSNKGYEWNAAWDYQADGPQLYPVGLAVINAESLPENGLTYYVQGDFSMIGKYNTAPDNKQPSAAFVSNRINLLSENYDFPEHLPMPQFHYSYPYGEDEFTSVWNPEWDGLPEGRGLDKNYDIVNGKNWYWYYKWDGPQEPELKMAHPVTGGSDTDGDGKNEIQYNISLVGNYVSVDELDHLELWKYFANPGDQSSPPAQNSWVEYEAVVTGSLIQLSNEFPSVGPVAKTMNTRACDQAQYNEDVKIRFVDTTDDPSPWLNDPMGCRETGFSYANPGTPKELLALYDQPVHVYDADYLNNPNLQPPGHFYGLSDGFTKEYALVRNNWVHHPEQFCGDNICQESFESCGTCEIDCGQCPIVCGDGQCDESETYTCTLDCPPVCGDGTCNGLDTCSNCSADCGVCPYCGDGQCNGSENCSTCSGDCGLCCGNHVCDYGETCSTCPGDCGSCPTCPNPNGICEPKWGENYTNCPEDCPLI